MRLDPADVGGPGDERTISLIAIANTFLRNRWLFVVLPAAALVVVAVLTLMSPRKYTSRASFMPQSELPDAARFSGLAAQFGIDLGASAPGQSPQFYADLVKSGQILDGVVEWEYAIPGRDGAHRETLVERFGHGSKELARGQFETVKKLRGRISVRVNPETGVLRIGVWSRNPELSRQIADRLLAELNRFNLETRQSQAAEERRFAGERVVAAKASLNSAETGLRLFLEQNRQFDASPLLTFEHDRLEREVFMRQQLYSSLATSYEQALIDEVRNTPVITVVEPPRRPVRPDRRYLLLKGLAAIGVGLVLALFIATGREIARRTRAEDPEDYEAFERLKRETRDDLKALRARFRRGSAPSF